VKKDLIDFREDKILVEKVEKERVKW